MISFLHPGGLLFIFYAAAYKNNLSLYSLLSEMLNLSGSMPGGRIYNLFARPISSALSAKTSFTTLRTY